jgi:hypothetical protein
MNLELSLFFLSLPAYNILPASSVPVLGLSDAKGQAKCFLFHENHSKVFSSF